MIAGVSPWPANFLFPTADKDIVEMKEELKWQVAQDYSNPCIYANAPILFPNRRVACASLGTTALKQSMDISKSWK